MTTYRTVHRQGGIIGTLIWAGICLLATAVIVFLVNLIIPQLLTWYIHTFHLRAGGLRNEGKAFFFGLWQGFFWWLDWVISWFRGSVNVYHQGASSTYKVGYILGVIIWLFGGWGLFWRR